MWLNLVADDTELGQGARPRSISSKCRIHAEVQGAGFWFFRLSFISLASVSGLQGCDAQD